jgi:manganese efflux pump family protein
MSNGGLPQRTDGRRTLGKPTAQTAAPRPRSGLRTPQGTAKLLTTGLALSIDNLVVGFALGTYHVSLAVAAALIAAVSVTLSLVGLELGGRLGEHLGQRTELLGGAILIAVGGAIAIGAI